MRVRQGRSRPAAYEPQPLTDEAARAASFGFLLDQAAKDARLSAARAAGRPLPRLHERPLGCEVEAMLDRGR